jgi:hypothetical protein
LRDFLRERADFADVTLGDGAENAVFVNEFAAQRGDGEMRDGADEATARYPGRRQ